MRQRVIDVIEKEKIIVIVRGVQRDKLVPLAQAMYEGGIRLLELTFSADKSVSDEETAKNIKLLADTFKDKMYIGGGTVLTTKQAEMVKEAGGWFVISPNTDVEVIQKTRELGMISMPGALTPTEIQSAHLAGADYVKLFPAANFGPAYIKAVSAPLSHIKFTAVGGINEKNMEDYLKVGVSGFGIGANIVDKKLLENNDYAGITKLAEEFVKVIK